MFCKCGCGNKTTIAKKTRGQYGHTAGLPVNYLIGHHRKKRIEESIRESVMPEPNNGCFLWIGELSPGGYGRKRYLGKRLYAHRLVYEMEHGEIPKDMTIDHLCRVRSCVNPKHMEVVTNKENILRGISPSALNFRKKFCAKCSGPYTKDNRAKRTCVNCRNTYRRNRRAINKRFGTNASPGVKGQLVTGTAAALPCTL